MWFLFAVALTFYTEFMRRGRGRVRGVGFSREFRVGEVEMGAV